MTEHPPSAELVWTNQEAAPDEATLLNIGPQLRTGIFFEFADRENVGTPDMRQAVGDLPSVAFNTFSVEYFRSYIGWVNDPSTSQDAPTDPNNPVWTTIYSVLDTQLGLVDWYWMVEYLGTWNMPGLGQGQSPYREVYLLPQPGSI